MTDSLLCRLLFMFKRLRMVGLVVALTACGTTTHSSTSPHLAFVDTTPVTTTLPQQTAIAPAVSTSTTVAPTTTTTTETPLAFDPHDYIDEQRMLHGQCGEWHDMALEVGWHEEEWPTLSTVLYTESRCDPLAWNGHDAGATQINKIHKAWAAEMGFNWPDDFFDPRVNLTFAYRLYSSREEKGLCGWKPWTEPCH